MSRYVISRENFAASLNTKASVVGLPISQFIEFRNTRVNQKALVRRDGILRVHGGVNCDGQCLQLDPTSILYGTFTQSDVRIPLHSIHQLPTKFTLDIVVNPQALDVGTGNCGSAFILGFDENNSSTTPETQPFSLFLYGTWDNTSSSVVHQIVFRLVDELGNAYTLVSADAFDLSSNTTVIPIRIVRDLNRLEMRIPTSVENVIQASRDDLDPLRKSIAPITDLIIGSLDNTGSTAIDIFPFIGAVDEFRIFHSALPGHRHAFIEFPDTRYPTLMAYYRFNDMNGLIWDESLNENHGTIEGIGTHASPGLVWPMNAIEGIAQYRSNDNIRKLIFAEGEQFYVSDI